MHSSDESRRRQMWPTPAFRPVFMTYNCEPKAGPPSLQRYTRQLDSQEDHLEKIHLTISDLQEKQSKAEEDLEKIVQEVTLDESF